MRALADPGVVGGAFRLRFEPRPLALRLVEWGTRLRVALLRMPYGDQALFVRRAVLESLGGVPQAPILEDLDLVRALKRRGRIACLSLPVTTSARRYRSARGPAHRAAQRGGGRRLVAGAAARAHRGLGSPMTAAPVRAPVRRRRCAACAATRCATAATTRSGWRPRSPTSPASSPCRSSSGWSVKAVVEGLGAQEVVRRVLWLALVTLARAVVRYFSRTLVFNAAREIEYELRNDIFAHLERLPQSFYFRWRTGDIMSRCVNDIDAVRLLLGVGLLNLVQTPDPVRRRDRRDARDRTRSSRCWC